MTKQDRIRKRRRRLWERSPNCHWCGTATILPHKGMKGRPPDNLATLDHLRSRYDPMRHEPNPRCDERTVLACWRCNNERCRDEQASLPVEVLRARAAHAKPFEVAAAGRYHP